MASSSSSSSSSSFASSTASSVAPCGDSILLQPYRALGLITDDLPFAIARQGTESFAVVSIGRAFQIFKCDKLGLAIVSPLVSRRIDALVAERGRTYTASGSQIVEWERAKQSRVFAAPTGSIGHLCCFGDVLVSLGADGTANIWNLKEGSLHGALPLSEDLSAPSLVMHPSTYLNKVVVANGEGDMELWNVRTLKRVYRFKGWGGTAINVVEQSPVADVVAVGLADGRVIVHNLRFDETVTTFHHDGGPVTALSFRTEPGEPPLLVSGGTSGNIVVWDLQAKQMHSRIADAHHGTVVGLSFLVGEPVLLSSGTDNSLRMWIFDQSDGSARLLRSREGHTAPPVRLRYYGGETMASLADGADGHSAQILSAGRDRAFRMFHAIRDCQSREMSQGHVVKRARKLHVNASDLKLPHVVDFATAEVRARDWCDIITCHANDPNAYTWHFKKRAIGKLVLTPPASALRSRRGKQYDFKTRTKSDRHRFMRGRLEVVKGSDHDESLPRATAVTISACGNFGIVGNSHGGINRYNMQSGMLRGQYPMELAEGEDETHSETIRGLAVDNLNRVLVSAGLDGVLAFWDFSSHKLAERIDVGSPISMLRLHRDSGLLVVTTDDFKALVYDMSTRTLVRRFTGHTNRITDASFTPDARWLLTSSMDSSVRIWDLPTGKCVDWVLFEDAPTGIAPSPTGEFFATSHVDQLGIFLWANKASFSVPDIGKTPTEPHLIDMPMPAASEESGKGDEGGKGGKGASSLSKAASKKGAIGSEADGESKGTDGDGAEDEAEEGAGEWEQNPAAEGCLDMVQLSELPRARWNTLSKLELIKVSMRVFAAFRGYMKVGSCVCEYGCTEHSRTT